MTSMLRVLFAIPAFLMCGWFAAVAADPAASIVIQAAHVLVARGDDVKVQLSLINNSSGPIYVSHGMGVSFAVGSGFSVVGPNGKPATLRPDDSGPTSSMEEILQPGDELHGTFVVSTIFDMSRSGTYSIQYYHIVSVNDARQKIFSNTINVTVK
jgi:hypothetical protein